VKIGIHSARTNTPDVDAVLAELGEAAAAGLSSYWAAMLTGQDTLTTLALAARGVPDIEVGTAVVPIPLRSPFALAQQALTIQQAIGGRLSLGIGTSHEAFAREQFRTEWDRPIDRARWYLTELRDIFSRAAGGEYSFPSAPIPQLLLGAVNPGMAAVAADLADGVVTWAAGVRTLHDVIAPAVVSRSNPSPFRVVVGLPICITSDVEGARRRIFNRLGAHDGLPSYQKVLQREGASSVSDVALIGTELEVADRVSSLAEAGATDFAAHLIVGSQSEHERTWEFLVGLASEST
jgi:F420-dependent oxidoreductase-like protein